MGNLVSVIVPAYNAERWLADALDSALAQTHPHVDVVVVDDGSSDETLAVARRYRGDRVRVIAQENQGACVARNRGLAEARGEFVKFLDADDVLAPDVVQAQLRHVGSPAGSERVVPFGDVVRVDEHLHPEPAASDGRRRYLGALASPDLVERIAALLTENIQTSLPLHRRAWLTEVGGFRAHLKRGQEYDLHLRLGLAGVRFLHVPHVSSYTRQHDAPHRIGNTSTLLSNPAASLSVLVERRGMLEDHFGTPLPQPVAAALAHSAWARTRQLARAGKVTAARQFTVEAKRLDPHMHQTGQAFRTLSRVCGPVLAERAIAGARQLLRRS